jgi:hypothetical protein
MPSTPPREGDFVDQPIGPARVRDIFRAVRKQHVPHKSVPIPLLAAGELRQVGLGQCFRGRHGVSSFVVMVAAAAATLAVAETGGCKPQGEARGIAQISLSLNRAFWPISLPLFQGLAARVTTSSIAGSFRI